MTASSGDAARVDVAEGRRLLAAATGRPWVVEVDGGVDGSGEGWSSVEIDFSSMHEGLMLGDHENAETDADLIVFGVNNLPALLAAVEAVEKVREALDEHVPWYYERTVHELRHATIRLKNERDEARAERDALRAELSAIHATTEWQRWAAAGEEGWRALADRITARAERAEAAVRRVEALIGGMHEDWCRGKHDAQRECECIRAEVLAALAGPGATT